jgi:hypothetical protein
MPLIHPQELINGALTWRELTTRIPETMTSDRDFIVTIEVIRCIPSTSRVR